jgi:hypothetical protein
MFNKKNLQQTITDRFAYLVFCISSYNGNYEFFSFDVFLQKSDGGVCTKIELKVQIIFCLLN